MAAILMLMLSASAWAVPYTAIINNFQIIAGSLIFQATRSPFAKKITLTPATPAADRVYTLADKGANGNVAITPVATADVAPDVVQHATVALSSANILGMFASPVTIIAAPAAGKVIEVKDVQLTMNTTATAYASGGTVTLNYAGGAAIINTIPAAVVTAGAGTSYTKRDPIDVTAAAATAITITNGTGAFTTGTGTAIVDVWYTVQ